MSSKATMKLQSALISTGLVQPVSEKTKGGYLEVLCRQIPGQEKAWLAVVDRLLEYWGDSAPDFEFHVCRRYVRKNGQMVFGWHISLDCKNAKMLDSSVGMMVSEVLEKVRASLESHDIPAAQAVASQSPKAVHREPLSPGQHPSNRVPPPRPPNEPGSVIGTPPPNFTPSLRVVKNDRDENGKITIIEEMALPHVYKETNIPTAKGKGAKYTGGM